ncbi:MAG: SpoIID/LytB domain-containing protein [Actinomycetales bacterium]
MKRFAVILAATLFSIPLVIPNVYGSDLIPAEFQFEGTGYGHGVGMSQIGARGLALEGKSAAEILSYFYPGTQLAPYPDNTLIRVNIANQTTTANLNLESGKGIFTLYQGDIPLAETPEPFGQYDGSIAATFTNLGGLVIPFLTSPTTKFAPIPGAKAWTIRWDPQAVVVMKSGDKSGRYKYGQITIKSVTTPLTSYLAVTTTLRLHDEYLYGLGEVPSSWPPAALDAQVIAARTYALNKLTKIRTECDCNIYSTTVDQNFVGYAKEAEPIYGIRWKEAVNRTFVDGDNSLIVTLDGKPINAFFFSSSGGKTQNIKEVWGSEFSYLQGVPDPWSQDKKINPRYAVWSRVLPQAVVAQAFQLPDVIRFTFDARTTTGSISQITGYSITGKRTTLTGEVFRSRVKLPSTWIFDKTEFVVILVGKLRLEKYQEVLVPEGII